MSAEQYRRALSWSHLPEGTRVHVSEESAFGLQDYRWMGGPGHLATVVSQQSGQAEPNNGCMLVLMDASHLPGTFTLEQSKNARVRASSKYVASIKANEYRFFWIAVPEAVRIYDPAYLENATAYGNHTCQCGAMNKDVSVSAIVNGKYMCYMCRVIVPRERAS